MIAHVHYVGFSGRCAQNRRKEQIAVDIAQPLAHACRRRPEASEDRPRRDESGINAEVKQITLESPSPNLHTGWAIELIVADEQNLHGMVLRVRRSFRSRHSSEFGCGASA